MGTDYPRKDGNVAQGVIFSPTPLIGAYYVPTFVSITESSRRSGIFLALLVVISAFSPLFSSVSATGAVELSLSNQHLLISPGTTANITLTIHNNDTQINDYTVDINQNYNPAWNISVVDSIVEDVLPTYSSTTTIVITLDPLALLSDQTVVELLVLG